MEFLYGVAGAAVVLALFFGGVFAGWKLKAYDDRRVSRRRVAELGEKERKRLEQEQEAFRLLQNYNTDRAYGVTPEQALLDNEVGGDRV